MSNYVREWREGYFEDEPLSRYEKLKKTPKHISNDKEKTIERQKARWNKDMLFSERDD